MHDERVLFVLNESTPGAQVGPRAVLERWSSTGRIAAPGTVAFDTGGGAAAAAELLASLHRVAARLQPTVILWEHPSGLPLDRDGLTRLRRALPRTVIVYREGDAYGIVRKRLTVGARRVAAIADVVFTPGLGHLPMLLRACGAGVVGWAPSVVDTIRFGRSWEPTPRRRWDVVVVGNHHRGRHPLSSLPGARQRAALVRALASSLGPDRFAVFGSGWDGVPGARGRLPFADQEATSRQARLTVSWDHFGGLPYFFSNRLPISLIAGVAHLTNRHPGYEDLFAADRELFLVDDVDAAVRRVTELLEGPTEVLDRVGAAGAALARRSLTTDVVYERMLRIAIARRDRGATPPPPSAWIRPPEARE